MKILKKVWRNISCFALCLGAFLPFPAYAGFWNEVGTLLGDVVTETPTNGVNFDTLLSNEEIGAGLFSLIADKEKKIRTEPAARTTELLKKVFGQE